MSGDKNLYICTIIAKNYIAFARTLCDSFLEYHPQGKCFVLVIDDFDGYINPASEKFEVISISSLNIPDLKKFCFKYNITELSTAVKPYLLRYLFSSKGIDKILYLDPDILILYSLENLYKQLDIYDIILTPHLDIDYPEDGKLPDDRHILISGIYNLGFIGLRFSENTSQFLEWWAGKLYNKCIIAHKKGYFVDQRFIDLVPLFFNKVGIIREPQYNVAYWNLHSRRITLSQGRWLCNGQPLCFFHFSNYKPTNPESISGHQNRFSLNEQIELKSLFEFYRERLLSNGYSKTFLWNYTYGSLISGKKIRDIHRKIYRMNIDKIPTKDPFSLETMILWIYGIKWLIKKILNKILSSIKLFLSGK